MKKSFVLTLAMASTMLSGAFAGASVVPQPAASGAVSKSSDSAATPDLNKSSPDQLAVEFPDGQKYTEKDVQQAISSMPAQMRNAPYNKLREAALYNVADRHILSQEAKKAGFDKSADVEKQTREAQDAVEMKAELDRRIDLKCTPEAKKKKYDELVSKIDKGEKEIRVRQISFSESKRSEAEALLKDIKAKKKTFDQVLESNANAKTKQVKGDIGYVRRSDVPKEFWDELTGSGKGEVLKNLQTVGELVLICVREDERSVKLPELKEVEDDLKIALTPELAIEAVGEMRKTSGVKIYGLDGKPVELDEKAAAEGEKDRYAGIDVAKLKEDMVLVEFKDGKKLTLKDIKESLSTLPPQLKDMPLDQILIPAAKRAADKQIIQTAARESGSLNDPKITKRKDEVSAMLIQKAFLDDVVEKELKNNPDLINKEYEEFKKVFPKDRFEARMKMILFKKEDQNKAAEVLRDLQSKKIQFDEAVKQYSIDEQTKNNGGDVGYLPVHELPDGFGKVISKSARATLVPEVIKLGDLGYAVVFVADKRSIEVPSKTQVEANIKRKISTTVALKKISELRKASGVKLFDVDGKKIEIRDIEIPAGQP